MPTQSASAMLKALQEHEAAQNTFINPPFTAGLTWICSETYVSTYATFIEVIQNRNPMRDKLRFNKTQWLTLRLYPSARVKRTLAQAGFRFGRLQELRELLVVASRYDKLKVLAKQINTL